MRLSDRQWELIEHLFPEPKRRRDGRGRPWASNRECVEGILWVLRTGARWRDLPAECPSGMTCWRRLRRWEDEGVWLEGWQQLLAALNHQQLLEWDETLLDGSFVSAKKGALLSEKPSAGRGQSGWYWSTARAFLWERNWRVLRRPKPRWRRSESRAGDGGSSARQKRVIADRAYDSNPLRDRLQKRGIELLVPHRRNRQYWWRQDGRKLRRYRRRWKVERTFAWLQNLRRLLVRQDPILTVYRGLFHFACLLITLRYL